MITLIIDKKTSCGINATTLDIPLKHCLELVEPDKSQVFSCVADQANAQTALEIYGPEAKTP